GTKGLGNRRLDAYARHVLERHRARDSRQRGPVRGGQGFSAAAQRASSAGAVSLVLRAVSFRLENRVRYGAARFADRGRVGEAQPFGGFDSAHIGAVEPRALIGRAPGAIARPFAFAAVSRPLPSAGRCRQPAAVVSRVLRRPAGLAYRPPVATSVRVFPPARSESNRSWPRDPGSRRSRMLDAPDRR